VARAQRLVGRAPNALDQSPSVVLNVVEDLADVVALDDVDDRVVAVVVEPDVDGIGVAEQVVQVAEDLLIGADQEDADVVGLAVPLVQLEHALLVAAGDELVDLAVAVAGEVGEHTASRRLLVEAMDRHHGEQLLHRPVVRGGLEQGEVSVVGVRELLLEIL
jgi:hypothetical protein